MALPSVQPLIVVLGSPEAAAKDVLFNPFSLIKSFSLLAKTDVICSIVLIINNNAKIFIIILDKTELRLL